MTIPLSNDTLYTLVIDPVPENPVATVGIAVESKLRKEEVLGLDKEATEV